MLLRLTAALLVLLGLAGIGTAVASATVWRPADTLVVQGSAAPGQTLLVTDAGVLDLGADTVSIRAWAQDGSAVFAAIGRENDVFSWVGADSYARVTGLVDRETLALAAGEAVVPTPSPSPSSSSSASPSQSASASPTSSASPSATPAPSQSAAPGTETDADAEEATPAPDPSTSDMWFARSLQAEEVTLTWTQEAGRFSLIVASLGTNPGPPTVELTWPQEVRTPWLVPGTVLGSVLLLAGLLLALWSWRRARAEVSGGTWTEVDASTGMVPVAASATTSGAAVPATAGSVFASGLGAPNVTAPHGSPGVAEPAPAHTSMLAPAPLTGPLTRRQIREAEQAAAIAGKGGRRTRRGSAGTPATGATPIVAETGGTAAADEAQHGLTAPAAETGATGAKPVASGAPGRASWLDAGQAGAAAPSATIPGFTAPVASSGWTPTRPTTGEPTHQDPAPRQGPPARAAGSSDRAVPTTSPFAPGPAGAPGPAQEPIAPASVQPGQPVQDAEQSWGVGASRADAWRKAWGFVPDDPAAAPPPQAPLDPTAPNDGESR